MKLIKLTKTLTQKLTKMLWKQFLLTMQKRHMHLFI